MSGTILVAGAINTDLIVYVDRAPEAGETITGNAFEMHGGGKAANQAVATVRSGSSVAILGGLGSDDFGAARRAGLESEGVETRWIQELEGVSSGVALITVESSGENRISYIPAATLAVSPEHCRAAAEAIGPSMVLAANELSPACLRELFEWAPANSVPVVYNVAPYSDDVRHLLRQVDVLIVNRGEAMALLGHEDENVTPEDMAARLRLSGVHRVVITLGSDGAIGMDDDGLVRASGVVVTPVDTTGAGDTFCGAFASRMNEGASFREAIEYGNLAGAISVTRRGAQPSIPWRDEIEQFAR